MDNAAHYGGVKDYSEPGSSWHSFFLSKKLRLVLEYMNIEAKPLVQEPSSRSPFARFLGQGQLYPLEQRLDQKRRGIGRQRHPFVGAHCAIIAGQALFH